MRFRHTTPMIAGVDLGGSKLSVSYFRGMELTDLTHHECKFGSRGNKMRVCIASSANNAPNVTVDYFFVEEPIVGRGVRASMQLSQMLGAFWFDLATSMDDNKVELVPVTTWKKHTVQDAHAGKDKVSAWLKETHPDYHERCGGNQDLVDATCIGLYGASVAAQSRSLSLQGGAGEHDEPAAGRRGAGGPAGHSRLPAP